jgi:superfamily II DNA or RNA helicase
MSLETFFEQAVRELLKKNYKLDDIKITPPFNNIPNEYWDKFNKKMTLRLNQQYVLDLLKKEGIGTGIHCQATGCGKSYLILMYCNEFKKNNKEGNIIIFTERVNILKDFFDLDKKDICENKKKLWKDNDLINLDNFEIINRVTNKKKDWNDILKIKGNKTKILLINRAFLTLSQLYKDLNKTHVGMIIHDECHNTPSDLCYEMLTHFKALNVPIIGFSATPLRTGKTSNEFNKDRLLNIYGNNGDLNILSNFNMMFAIEKNLILPPKFVWYELPKMDIDKNGNILNTINKNHVGSVFSVLEEVIPTLTNKKIIAWCGTIVKANKWISIFEKNRDFCDAFKNFTYCIDHSQINSNYVTNNYESFKQTDKNAILFCADKHREGSDIPNLDCCIFMDFVKNRSPVPFIQSIGRVLRKDDNINKKEGVVIDSFIPNSETYDRELVEKIFGYYISFENLSDKDIDNNKYNKYLKMRDLTKFDVTNQNICFEISDDKIIKIDCRGLKWNDIQNKFDPLLQDKIKLSAFDNFKSKSKILKDKFDFNKNTDFIKEYENISEKDKLKYNLPDINQEEYLKLFNIYSWFDLLDIKHDFIKLEELIPQLKNKNITQEKWIKLSNKNECIPKYPKYVYKNFTFKMLNNENLTNEI